MLNVGGLWRLPAGPLHVLGRRSDQASPPQSICRAASSSHVVMTAGSERAHTVAIPSAVSGGFSRGSPQSAAATESAGKSPTSGSTAPKKSRKPPFRPAADDTKPILRGPISRSDPVKIETLETADEAVASAAQEEEEAQPKPADTSGGGGVSSTAVAGLAAAAMNHQSKPVCYESNWRSDTCEAAGDVRVQGRSQTIHIRPLEQQ